MTDTSATANNATGSTTPPLSIDLAVFDIAGTTVDEGSAVYTAMRKALAEQDVEVDQGDLDRNKGTDKRTALATLMKAAGHDAGEDAVERCYTRFGELLDEAYTATPPVAIPGAIDCLEALRARGVRTALTTGFTRKVAERVLGLAGIGVGDGGPVDVLVTTDDVRAARPAPYMIQHAMEATDARDVRRVLSAGDTIADILSHRNAGVMSVSVLTGDTSEETLRSYGPDFVLASVADIPSLLEG